jgi:hypothetical protein
VPITSSTRLVVSSALCVGDDSVIRDVPRLDAVSTAHASMQTVCSAADGVGCGQLFSGAHLLMICCCRSSSALGQQLNARRSSAYARMRVTRRGRARPRRLRSHSRATLRLRCARPARGRPDPKPRPRARST